MTKNDLKWFKMIFYGYIHHLQPLAVQMRAIFVHSQIL